jgi:tRNA(Arg) A34 adenosine deaminase TadA
MELVLALAEANVAHRTGGPFAAAVYTGDGVLAAVGVNRVEPLRAAVAHAEVVAIALAGQAAGSYHLGRLGAATLVASTEPCAMCFGAVPWAGVARLVCGARDADARRIGFDEGDKPRDWAAALRRRGIEVVRDVLRDRAVQVLEGYARQGGTIYNGAPTGREPGGR